ncbi:MAG: Rieske (2Fe-2S) protein [Steroidobacteraceae bacterium]
MAELKFVPALPLSALPTGQMRACTVDGRELLLCRTREGLHVVDNICTHAFARLVEGRLRGTKLQCPLHGAVFDVRDGRVLKGPATEPLPAHHWRIVDDQVEVALDPAAAPRMSG